ncbi:MAG TPA: hypothetical protein VMR34_04710 [Candidatus Saccharimonadales bacterium]|nr:hypothetical protein [Candidatus Saccharimonadales bacterium]
MAKSNQTKRSTQSLKVTKQELSGAGHVLGDKKATKAEKTDAALLLRASQKSAKSKPQKN